MLALSPPLFSSFGWPLENYIYKDNDETSESFLHFPSSHSTPSTAITSDPSMVKKLNHNANERDRRRKINTLYSSLRSLLPPEHQKKKLSIPSTVSRVLKYIPELQQQVERLVERKEEVLSRICRRRDLINHQEKQRKCTVGSPLSAVSASRLSDEEVVVQISTYKAQKSQLPEILLNLEEDGLHLLNASSSESFGGRVFYNLHLQGERSCILECQALKEKLLSLYEKREEFFP